ncbi:MAG: replication initiation protein [Psychroflexus sp.]|nr:replication initiation protein [Psychroflexus sp.]
MTKYRNELNTVPMRSWTSEEQDFFFAIITEARNKGTGLLKFNKADLTQLANYSDRYNKRFVNVVESLGRKIAEMNYYEKKKNSFKIMNLFQRFEVEWSDDYSEMHAEVRVSEDFEYILNKLEANFTQFELQQFTNIRSTYAKEMFKKLKQWRTVGKKEYSIDMFREMLQIPESYRATDINQVVLRPIISELSNYFLGLKVKPIKARKRGNPITAYEFSWKAESTERWNKNKYEKENNQTKSYDHETLPEWAKNDYIPEPDALLPSEEQAKFLAKLEQIRKNNNSEN